MDSAQLIATPPVMTLWAPTRPMRRPNRPARIAPSKGASTMISRWVLEMAIFYPLISRVARTISILVSISAVRGETERAFGTSRPDILSGRSPAREPLARKRADSPLERIDLSDVDRAAVTEQRDQDRQTDR